MISFSEESEEVLYTSADITALGQGDMDFLKDRAENTARRRCRLCTHPNPSSALHEMLIVHAKGAYVRPHKHIGKAESHHVVEGTANALIFDNFGNVRQTINLGSHGSGKLFYYRMPAGIFHTLVITSEWFIFHETTTGPFDRNKTVFAPWSPDESEPEAVARYIARVL
jgi:cupin fold WbuC family metalloprotein